MKKFFKCILIIGGIVVLFKGAEAFMIKFYKDIHRKYISTSDYE